MSYLAMAKRLLADDAAGVADHSQLQPSPDPIETADLGAVLLRGTVLGDVWLVADESALSKHPDIERSGAPVFFFAEVPHLAHAGVEGLAALTVVKRQSPTARILQ